MYDIWPLTSSVTSAYTIVNMNKRCVDIHFFGEGGIEVLCDWCAVFYVGVMSHGGLCKIGKD